MTRATTSLNQALQASLTRLDPGLVAFHREIHAHPELAWHEVRTTESIGNRLLDAGYRVSRVHPTGLVADIGAHEPEHRVALRADIDALPVVERTDLDWTSVVDGVSHSCGHDIHMAAALGAGLALSEHVEELDRARVGVRLVFQPAEEVIPGGARVVIDQGWLDGVDSIYALHCEPSLDVGQVGLRVGPLTAACDAVTVTLHGSGGHTSRPHVTQDLTFALGKVITDVPAVLSRRVDPRAGLALVWGSVHSGGANNVIPSTGVVAGTVRVLDAAVWQHAGELIEQIIREVLAPYAVQVDIDYTPGLPPVVNKPDSVGVLRQGLIAAGAQEQLVRQSLGGEDFAWYLTVVPGGMARLGTRTPGGPTYDLHQGDYVVDERAVGIGARVMANTVAARLESIAASAEV